MDRFNKLAALIIRLPMLTGGIIIMIIGIGHIFMPTTGYEDTVTFSMAPAIRNHFYYLGTYAICIFLLALGFISIYFSRIELSIHTIVISSVLAIVWTGRVIFEFIYPVDIKIFMLQKPHNALRIVISILALLYSITSFYGWTIKDNFRFQHKKE